MGQVRTIYDESGLTFFSLAITVLKHISIHQRLLSGYVLILGLAVTGTIAGLVIGNRYQRHALSFHQAAAMEHSLLKDVQVGILYNRPTKQLSPYLNDPVRFKQESQKFLNRVQIVRSLMKPHQTLHSQMLDNHLLLQQQHRQHEVKELHTLLSQGEERVQEFYNRTQTFIQVIESLGYTPKTLNQAQKEMLTFAQSEEFRAFIELSDQLEPFIVEVKQREMDAAQSLG